MICPKCGFKLNFFETKCPACKQYVYEEKGRKLKLGRFFFFFSILLVISILSVISPYVPPLEHFFASCGKFFDDFWLLFGLKPTNSRNDIRILITLCFISPIVVYILSDVIVVKKKDDEE